jgi:tRNA-dependent cyclodipeptide synthase
MTLTYTLLTPPPTEELLGRTATAIKPHPATENCQRLLARGEHVLLGVSPFNTKFTESYVTQLIRWADETFDSFTIALPGAREAALMLEAAGTPAGKAARKTRHELNRNTRLIQAALKSAGVPHDERTVVRVSDFSDIPAYRAMVEAAETTYRDNSDFRAACQEMSALVVRGRQRATTGEQDALTTDQIELAAKYIFAEIPLFLNTPALLSRRSSLLAYHRPWPIGDLLFSGTLPIRVDDRQGYLVLESRQEAAG